MTLLAPHLDLEPRAPSDANKVVFAVESWDSFGEDLKTLIYRHWREAGRDQREVPLDMDYGRYAELDRQGMLHIVTLRLKDRLIGYFVALITPHLHYKSTLHALVDIYYIMPEHRRGFTALRMFGTAHRSMKERGVVKVLSGTKLHSGLDMSKLFHYMGYGLAEHHFTKLL